MAMPDRYDAVIVGAGHNGLVAANYLARAGKKVLVAERRHIVGGACVTEEFFPGARFSSCAFIQAVLRPRIVGELELNRFGLEMYAPDPQGFALFEDGSHIFIWQDVDKTLSEIAARDPEDAKAYLRFGSRLRRFGELTSRWLLTRPPPRSEVVRVFEDAGEADLLDEFLFSSTRDLLDRYFRSKELRGYLTFFGVVSIWGGPSTPGTGYLFGYHASGEFEGSFGRWAFPRGGMGAITAALRRGAEHHGTVVLTDAEVSEIRIERGSARGFVLSDGQVFEADAVISNADPKRTFLGLIPPRHLKEEFRAAVARIDNRGTMARIHLLIDELPHYVGFADASNGPQHRGHQLLGCSEERFEEAYAAMLRGDFPQRFAVEAIIQSATDDGLCPPGKHAMILGVQNLPFELAEGTWDGRREEFADRVMESVYAFAPNLRHHVLARHVITPLDLERTYGITGGNIFHTAMVIQHLYGARPLPELADYRSPIKGLYLCGAGTHPGGGVIGAPGHNAAAVVLDDLDERTSAGRPRVRDRLDRPLLDRALESKAGLSVGYLFARSRMFRNLARLALRTRSRE